MKRILVISSAFAFFLLSCTAVPSEAGADGGFAKEDYAHLYFAGNDISGTPVLYSNFDFLDRSGFEDVDDFRNVDRATLEEGKWFRVYVSDADAHRPAIPASGSAPSTSYAAPIDSASEGSIGALDPLNPVFDEENTTPFEDGAPGTLFLIHFDYRRSHEHYVYPATLYVYSYEVLWAGFAS